MRPCDVCGQRIMPYGGTCKPCAEHRHEVAATQWAPSYEARTAALDAHPGRSLDVMEIAQRQDTAANRRKRKSDRHKSWGKGHRR